MIVLVGNDVHHMLCTKRMKFAVTGVICMGTRCPKVGTAWRCGVQGRGQVPYPVSCSAGTLCHHEALQRCELL